MHNPIIYEISKGCEHCGQLITGRLRSDDPDFLKKAPGLKDEVLSIPMNLHWYKAHHICAKCGKLIESGETTFALKSSIDWPINETYLKWNAPREHYGAVNLHKSCAEA